MSWFDLRRDLMLPGCAVCRGGTRTARRYLSSLLWEFVNDPGVRIGLRAAHGFCRDHTQLALAVASREAGRVGMAILAEDLLRHVREDAERRPTTDRRRRRPGDGRELEPVAPCPACVESQRTEDAFLRHLAGAHRGDAIDRLATDGAPHLCFPHLPRGLAIVRDRGEPLVRTYRCGEEGLRRDLAELIRKHDYRFQHEGLSPEESDAWIRGFRLVAGEPIRLTDDAPPRTMTSSEEEGR